MSLYKEIVYDSGHVSIEIFDEQNRHLLINFIIPLYVFQTIIPIILAYGYIDKLNVPYPIKVLYPEFGPDDLIKNDDSYIKLNEMEPDFYEFSPPENPESERIILFEDTNSNWLVSCLQSGSELSPFIRYFNDLFYYETSQKISCVSID